MFGRRWKLVGLLLLAGCSTNPGPTGVTVQAVSCASWSAGTAYVKGDTVTRNGATYRANWWTQGNDPATSSGPEGSGQPWTVTNSCGAPPPPPPPPAPSGAVCFFEHDNYGGASFCADGDSSWVGDAWNDRISSVRVRSGFRVEIFNDRDYRGALSPLSGDTASLPDFNDRASSFKITLTPPPPPPVGSGGFAKHALIGYWHNFTNPSGPTYPLSEVDPAWDVINVAFAENAQNGNVSFVLDPGAGGEARFIADVRAKRAQGKKVVLSLGGQNGSVTVNSEAEADNFANSLYAIMQKYGFDGVDVDLESGVAVGTPILTYLPVGIKKLKAKVGPGFYLSMAPEWVYVEGGYTSFGGPWGAYLPMIDALRGDLSVLHPQYYNNGSVYTPYQAAPFAAGSADQLVATAKMLIEGFS